MTTRPAEGYTRLQIALHWIIAVLVAGQILFGEAMQKFVDAAEEGVTLTATDSFLASVHYWAGIAVLVLAVVRLGARLTFGAPAHAGRASPMQVRAAGAVHGAFYVLLFAMPILGLMAFYFGDPWGPIHTLGKPVLVVLIAGHALIALYNQFVRRDGTLMRILISADKT